MYSFKIYEGDNLVRNFIPALDSSGRPCMYDTISKQPFYNQGSVEFLYNSNVPTYANGLPKTFTELEYLQSTGTQYIDTGYKATTNTKMIIDYTNKKTIDNNFNPIITAIDSNGYGYSILVLENTNQVKFRAYGTKLVATDIYLNVNDRYKYILEFGKLTINEKEYTAPTYNNNLNNILLLKRRLSEIGATGLLHSVRIYEVDNLVRNFIPALDPNGRPCMYDTVSKSVFYNSGTEEFLYGLKE